MNKKRYKKFRKNKIKFINNINKSLKLDIKKSWDKFRSLNGFRKMIEQSTSLVNKIKEDMDINDGELEDFSPFVVPIVYIPGGNPFRSTLDSKFVIFKIVLLCKKHASFAPSLLISAIAQLLV